MAALRTLGSRGFRPELGNRTSGANVQIYYVACIANPGDEIITVDPCFVSYRSIFKFLVNGKFVKLKRVMDLDLIQGSEKAITPKKGILIITQPDRRGYDFRRNKVDLRTSEETRPLADQ